MSLKTQWMQLQRATAAGGHGLLRQLIEMLLLKVLRGLGPTYYARGRFARRTLAWQDKWNHANEREYRRFVHGLNPPEYQKLSQHKVVEKSVLSLAGIPTPTFRAFVHAQRGFDGTGQPLTNSSQFSAWLKQHAGRRLCFKMVEGYGGEGFAALDVLADGCTLQHPLSLQRHSADDWLHHLLESPEGWLVEDYVQQHAVTMAMNPSSLNTVRAWVIDRGQGPTVTHALLRIGHRGAQTDNTTGGGLAINIDVERGVTLASPLLDRYGELLERHPEHGGNLVGIALPDWSEAQRLACRAVLAFPNIHFAGVDIAFSATGPLVIELNVFPDRISAMRWDLPLRRYFAGP